jgi:hypothetical protein
VIDLKTRAVTATWRGNGNAIGHKWFGTEAAPPMVVHSGSRVYLAAIQTRCEERTMRRLVARQRLEFWGIYLPCLSDFHTASKRMTPRPSRP